MSQNPKKQVPLRLSPELYADIAQLAEDNFRSVNGQIEYLLNEYIRMHKKNKSSSKNDINTLQQLDIK